MRNKRIEKLFVKESNQINVPQSEKLKSTPINCNVQKKANKLSFAKWKMIPVGLCSLVLIFVTLFAIVPSFNGDTGEYTSYILEINPQFCITTDKEDKVISITSLNDDGDLVLSDAFFNDIENGTVLLNDCLDRIITFVYNENPDQFTLENGIKIYVTNDVEKIARDKLSKTKQHISNKLNDIGKLEVLIEEFYMDYQDFGNKMGFDNFKGLDKMIGDIIGKDKFFDPNKNMPPMPDNPNENPNDNPDHGGGRR